jgi:hypothetical protein
MIDMFFKKTLCGAAMTLMKKAFYFALVLGLPILERPFRSAPFLVSCI